VVQQATGLARRSNTGQTHVDMVKSTFFIMLLWGLFLMAGCVEPKPVQDPAAGYPPDLTLVFVVDAPTGDGDLLSQPARYIVEPDRTLRVALGPGAIKDQYPPPTAKLTPDQMRHLYNLTLPIDWHPLKTGPQAQANVILYRAALTQHGETRLCHASPKQSPGLTRLLAYLVELSGR